MTLDDATVTRIAATLDDAAMAVTQTPKITLEFPELRIEDAYRIQRANIARRLSRGETLVGMKMGLTSLAKMEQMGVHDPIYGHLTNTMLRGDGDPIVRSEHGQPRVEPEVAFLLDKDLSGRVTPAEAMQAVGGVCAAIEVIDSRFAKFQFTLIDVVADNASSTRFFIGSTVRPPSEVDLGNLGMVLRRNGRIEKVGSSAAILEHPARSLARLSIMLDAVGEGLRAGQIVLAGGATAAIHVDAGDHIRLDVDGLGSVETSVIA